MKSSSEKGNASESRISEASGVKNQAINQGIDMTNSTEVSSHRAITVPFHGAELYVVEHNGQPYTPMKPIVEGAGLTWQPQHRKLVANRTRWGVVEITIPSTMVDSTTVGTDLNHQVGDTGQRRAMTCIALRKLPGWLASIEQGKVKNPEVRARVVQYQNECDDVLWQYWNEGIVVNPRVAYSVHPDQTLSAEQAQTLREMLESHVKKLPKEKQAGAMIKGWSKLKAHFKTDYRHIPASEFHEAVSIVARHTAEFAEWEVVDDELKQDQGIDPLNAEALMTARKAAHTYFDAVRAGKLAKPVEFPPEVLCGIVAESLMRERMLLSFNHEGRMQVTPVSGRAYVLSFSEFIRGVSSNDIEASNAELADLASACSHRLAKRMQHEDRRQKVLTH